MYAVEWRPNPAGNAAVYALTLNGETVKSTLDTWPDGRSLSRRDLETLRDLANRSRHGR